MAPEAPFIPQWSKLKQFAIGMVWASAFAAGSSVTNVLYDVLINEFTDWHRVKFTAAMAAVGGAVGYWRKYVAWLTSPPAGSTYASD